jgi:hypothetical protein
MLQTFLRRLFILLPVIYLCVLLSGAIREKPTKSASETFAEVGKQLDENRAEAVNPTTR